MYNYTQLDPEECRFVTVAQISEVPNGERLFIEVDGEFLVVFNIAGDFYVIADQCSHDNGPLGDGEVEGTQIICPRHGACFDLKTGEALTVPAVEDIPAYLVRVQGEDIQIGFTKE